MTSQGLLALDLDYPFERRTRPNADRTQNVTHAAVGGKRLAARTLQPFSALVPLRQKDANIIMGRETHTVGSLKAPQNSDSVALLGDVILSYDEDGGEKTTQAAVIGTYELQQTETSRARKGSAVLVHATRTRDSTGTSYALTKRSASSMPGVLDVCGHDGTVFAACSENSLTALSSISPHISLTTTNLLAPDSSETLTLSLDVSTEDDETFIATSHSTGDVSVYKLSDNSVDLLDRRKIHDLEAWTVAQRKRVLYTGGDDGTLVAWTPDAPGEIFRLRQPHDGIGVTAVAMQPGREHELWSGGYDDHVRVWDVRHMQKCLDEKHVGGGVWRIKFHPSGLVLVAAMYDGFKVLRRQGLKILARYNEHGSLAYGATWVPELDSRGTTVALTASFYDCAVRLWTVDSSADC